MTKFCLWPVCILAFFTSRAQFADDFSDGNFTNNPTWTASPADFVVNSNQQLQSANSTANATFSIYTPSALALKAQWEFWVKLDFNPSSVNYVDVWLISQSEDLNAADNAGYFVRIGSTDDNISLFRKPVTGSAVRLIEGVKGLLNSSSSIMKIKVIRTAGDQWILLRDMTATGQSYRSEGETINADISSSAFFGLSIRQSTASFFQKHFFDDFDVRAFPGAPTSLSILSIKATSPNTAQILFDNAVNISSAENISAYHASGIGNPVSAVVDAVNGSAVLLTFSENFTPNVSHSIIVDQVTDVFGNTVHQQMSDFTYYQARRYDVVISEIFADPSPQVGLPAQKFIELKNTAAFPVNLSNWQIRDASNVANLPAVELLPDSFLIVTTASGLDAYKSFGKTVAVSGFPSLNIGGSEVALYDQRDMLMHAMGYDLSSYGNEAKKEGGFSLEMVNTRYGCGGPENWMASNDASGGTPGRKNSVDDSAILPTSIAVTNAWLRAPDTLMIRLSKTVDSASTASTEIYSFNEGLAVKNVEVLPPLFDVIRITLQSPAAEQKIYQVTVSSLTDCGANNLGAKKSVRFGMAQTPAAKDIVINEILSEPLTSGSEFVELYNNSNKTVDASQLLIANRNSSGEVSSVTIVTSQQRLIFPGDFLVLTRDPAALIRDYPFAEASALLKMTSMPSIPNEKGFVVIMNRQGDILDEVNYQKNWHFALVKDRKGVSLERISYSGPSEATNFHSAAKDIGYGTPGAKNSQMIDDANSAAEFSISPGVFSPDNDGVDDFVTISYNFKSAGYVTNIKIFDGAGRMVRYLEKNSLSGVKGYYRWDGLDDKAQKLPQGIYVIYFESFDENGRKIAHRKPVVLARRL